jgi:hypothetical protein
MCGGRLCQRKISSNYVEVWSYSLFHCSLLCPYASPISRNYFEQLVFKYLLLLSFHTLVTRQRFIFELFFRICHNYYTYLLTPWSRANGSQPVKKFPAFYGTRRVITRHLSLSSARSIQSNTIYHNYYITPKPPYAKFCRNPMGNFIDKNTEGKTGPS